ncbi:DsbA family protein [Nonomuraea recticatena]
MRGTPTLFVNGARYTGPLTLEALTRALRDSTPMP